MLYTLDTKSNDNYFIVIDENGKSIKVAKSCNTLDSVKKLVGLINIKNII